MYSEAEYSVSYYLHLFIPVALIHRQRKDIRRPIVLETVLRHCLDEIGPVGRNEDLLRSLLFPERYAVLVIVRISERTFRHAVRERVAARKKAA